MLNSSKIEKFYNSILATFVYVTTLSPTFTPPREVARKLDFLKKNPKFKINTTCTEVEVTEDEYL
jgi:hypothetical protein